LSVRALLWSLSRASLWRSQETDHER